MIEYKDLISIVLSVLTIGVVLSGAIGFFTIRNKAKKEARKIASKIAEKISKDIAERVANEYIQQNLPAILESYNLGINNFDVEKLQESNNET